MNSIDKFSFDEIGIMLNSVCHKLDWMVQNDKQHTKKYSSLIKLNNKLSIKLAIEGMEIEREE